MTEGVQLGPAQRRGLMRLGDVLVPGDAELPRFSETGSEPHVERLLAHLSPADRRGVELLLWLAAGLPRFALRALLRAAHGLRRLPGPLGAPFRLLEIGAKGVVMTLYYADVGDASIHKRLGYDASVLDRPVEEDAPPPPGPPRITEAARAKQERPPLEGAVERARAAAEVVRRLAIGDRIARLRRLRAVVLERREEIVDRIQEETRKSRTDALVSEIFGVLDNLAWLEKAAPRALRDRRVETPIALLGKRSRIWLEPLGTILVIAPWNYPFYQALVPIASAFAAGNAVLFKPSEWTPLEGLVEDLLAEAGFAPGWVQVHYGDGAVGAALVAQGPDKVFFTGSTRTGRRIMAQAAEHPIPVELELGGKDAMIVFEDACLERAAAGAAWGALTNCGQSCTSVERLYVQESIYEPFREVLVREVERLEQRVDPDGDADLGLMTTPFQVEIVARQVADARRRGARFWTGSDWDGRSAAIPPMVVDQLSEEMELVREETFGPLLCLLPFRDEAEVVRRANDSPFGLTASVWSADRVRAERVARSLRVGGVSINNVMATEANPALPFGGQKQSGFGRYKGEIGLQAFCNVKSVLIDGNGPRIEANWYPYTREKYRLFSDLMRALFRPGRRAWGRFVWTGLRLERESKRAHREGRQR